MFRFAAAPSQPAFRVLVVGECGDGKSTLINNMLGLEGDEAATTGRAARGVTKNIVEYVSADRLVCGKTLIVLDSPGVGDKDVSAMTLLSLIEENLTDRGDEDALDCLIVTSPVTDGRVKLGAQVVQTLVDKGFVGRDRWQNVLFVGTKMDKGEKDDYDFFLSEVKDEFFGTAMGEKHGMAVLTGKDDISQMWPALETLPSSKVQYTKPDAEVMSQCLAEKLGISEDVFQEKLLEERSKAERAAAEAREAIAQAEKARLDAQAASEQARAAQQIAAAAQSGLAAAEKGLAAVETTNQVLTGQVDDMKKSSAKLDKELKTMKSSEGTLRKEIEAMKVAQCERRLSYDNTILGILCENGSKRLDIGNKCVYECSASHDSWATRLVFRRLDGPNEGDVSEDHIFGVFCENGSKRLDIGIGSMYADCPASHSSWATRLFVRRLDGANTGSIQYGHVVGIFCEDGSKRLDIGYASVKTECPGDHDSWATRLRVELLAEKYR